MKQLYFLLFFSLILGLMSFGQTSQSNKKALMPKQEEPAEQQKILQIEEDLRKAKIENNVQLIGEILADDYKGLNQYGVATVKAEGIANWVNNKNVTISLDSVTVTLVDNTTAIARGFQTENNLRMTFERKYLKQDGNWRIIFNRQKMIEFKGTQGIGKYRIVGHLNGADGLAISLMTTNSANGKISNLNTAVIKDGTFMMEGQPIEYPQMVFLTTPGKNERAFFFLENSEITLTGDLDSLSKVTVTGSKTQNEFLTHIAATEAFKGDFESLMKEMQSANQNRDTTKMVHFKKEFDAIMTKVNKIRIDFVKNNPHSYVNPGILQGLINKMKLPEFESLVNSIDPEVARTVEVIFIKNRIKEIKSVDIGQKAPDFTINDANGVPVSLSSKVGSKLLLIDFWAAWCAPCRAENPKLVKVYNEFKSKGFDILGVSLDRTKEDWIQAIAKDNLTWTQVSDLKYTNSPVAKLYAVNSIPSNFLLDQNGTIVAKNVGGKALYNIVKRLLSEK